MEKKERYVFPAILTYEDGYEIAVTFPDLPGCATSGETEGEAISSAREALGGHLWCLEKDGDEIPEPTAIKNLQLEENETVVLVDVSMQPVRLSQENKSVNRTVTLPAWMNALAVERGVNFSQVLQEALTSNYGITRAKI